MKKEYLIIGIGLAIAGLWYYTSPKTNYVPSQRQRLEGIGDGVPLQDHTGLVMDLTGQWVTPEEFARRTALRDPNKFY